MSVRNSLLAILTMGPAYGFQLHGELDVRTAGRRRVNVGQIYSTLERLVGQDAVESAGSTSDGLPLYRLTDLGRTEALAWLHDTASATADDWDEMLERVLIASSLPHIDVTDVVSRYRAAWTARQLPTPPSSGGVQPGLSGQAGLSAAADTAQAQAAIAWLDEVSLLLQEDAQAPIGPEAHRFHRELSVVRPKRGRRPTLATAG